MPDSRAMGPARLQPLTSEPWQDLAPVSSMTGKLADSEPRLWGCEQGNSCTLQHELCTSTHGHLISIKEPLFHYLLTSPPWVKFFVNEGLKHGERVFSPPSYAQKIKLTTQLDRITLNVKEYKKEKKKSILRLYAPSEYLLLGYLLCALFWVIGSNNQR